MTKTCKGPPLGEGGPSELHSFSHVCNSPLRPKITATQAQNPAGRARLRYLASRLHALGPKPLFHFLDEVERCATLRDHLEEYASLPADFVRAYGGDQFASPFGIKGGYAP